MLRVFLKRILGIPLVYKVLLANAVIVMIGRFFFVASSKARVIFSPATDPIDPIINKGSNITMTHCFLLIVA